jgi:hypothetical protein
MTTTLNIMGSTRILNSLYNSRLIRPDPTTSINVNVVAMEYISMIERFNCYCGKGHQRGVFCVVI